MGLHAVSDGAGGRLPVDEIGGWLPPREFRAGYAEVAKYGLIDRPDFFAWLERNWQDVFAGGAARIHVSAMSDTWLQRHETEYDKHPAEL